jgi:hypothetical protein
MKPIKKNFYDFNRDSPEERQERNRLYPELAKFHIALREELGDEEYQEFYQAEKESVKRFSPVFHQTPRQWVNI